MREWPLSAVEFDVLWRDLLRFGEPPYPLDVPTPGATYTERAEIVAAVADGLAARGLVAGREPAPDLADAMAMLATSPTVMDGRLQLDDDHVRMLATRVGERAAMALQVADRLKVIAMDGALLGAAIAELLPPAPPASGQSVSLPHQVLTDALRRFRQDGSLWDFEQALKAAGVRGQDVRWIAGMVNGNEAMGAQFGVTARRDGSDHRLGMLSWFATADGGVLMQPSHGGDWITIAPGDAARLVVRLQDLAAAG